MDDKWQLIETAPRDGTRVILYARDCGSQSKCDVQIGFYLGMRFGTISINKEQWTGWLSVTTHDDGHGGSENEYLTPTHWMPLPDPPKG